MRRSKTLLKLTFRPFVFWELMFLRHIKEDMSRVKFPFDGSPFSMILFELIKQWFRLNLRSRKNAALRLTMQ